MTGQIAGIRSSLLLVWNKLIYCIRIFKKERLPPGDFTYYSVAVFRGCRDIMGAKNEKYA